MSFTSIINSALSSMQASQLGISVASNNIANANNLQYTKQRLVTAPALDLDSDGSGSGVQVLGVEALRNQIIERRLRQEDSSKAGADTLNRMLGDIEVLFSGGDTSGLQQSISKFFNTFQTLSTDPSSAGLREQVRTSAQALANEFKQVRGDLVRTQTAANSAISDRVAKINSLAGQIARLSGEIADFEITAPANDLRDQRSALVRELSGITEVHELDSDGTYQLTIGNNRQLVLGPTAFALTTAPGTDGFARIYTGTDEITSEMGNGELRAQLDVRDKYVPNYLNAIDQLAYEIVRNVNAIHAGGYDQGGITGIDFFTGLSGPDQAASLMSLSTDVAASATHIAASGQSSGQDNQTATKLGNLLFDRVFTGGSVTDQYSKLVFTVGSDVANAETSLREHEALALQLQTRRQSMSGVSIDEETVQMLQFQRAFEASARVLRTVDELTQVLLSMGGRG